MDNPESEVIGILGLAGTAAKAVNRPLSRYLLLVEVAVCAARKGQIGIAEGILVEISSELERLTGFDRIMVSAECGYALNLAGHNADGDRLLLEAQRAANEMPNWLERTGILSKLVEIYCDLGRHAQAESVAEHIESPPHKSAVLTTLARKYMAAGLLEAALHTTTRMLEASVVLTEIVLKILEGEHIGEHETRLIQMIRLRLSTHPDEED